MSMPAARACVDAGDDLGHLAPVGFAGGFEVPDLDGDVGFAADARGLVDGVEHGIAFAAHVGGVDAAVRRGGAGKGDELRSFGVGRGRVLQRGGNAHGAVAHRLANEVLHLVKLGGGGLHVGIAEHHAADRCGADVGGEVNAHALLFEAGEVLAEGAPVGRDVEVVVAGAVGGNGGVVDRRNGVAFAGDFGGDALEDLGGQARVDEDGELGLAEHVDESGRDDFAGGVDGALGGRTGEVADGGDAAIADADVAGVPGRAGAVDDVAVRDDDVKRRGWRSGRGEKRQGSGERAGGERGQEADFREHGSSRELYGL